MKSVVSVSFIIGLIACTTVPVVKAGSIDASVNNAGLFDAGTNEASINVECKELLCPLDMVEVKGNYCPEVEQTCLEYDESVVNVNGKVRCLRFAPTKCLSKKLKPMHFCINRHEGQNIKGEIPEVMVSWIEAKFKCEALGKRLCKDYEWEFACEGNEALPYPTGLTRPVGICNIDHPWRAFDGWKLSNPKTRQAEVDRLSQRVPSGSMPGCISPFGVFDMVGNTDESVINTSGKPYKSGEKGGHWCLGARNRCRPMTTIHNEYFSFYEISWRCCKDIK